MTIQEWREYLRELAIDNAFNGRPVLQGVDWSLRPVDMPVRMMSTAELEASVDHWVDNG
jgi:hypothetical protein